MVALNEIRKNIGMIEIVDWNCIRIQGSMGAYFFAKNNIILLYISTT